VIVFLRPGWLLVLPLALALGWAWWRANSGAAPWRRAVDAELLAALAGRAPARARAPLALAALALGLASLALAGPSWRSQPAPPARALSARVVVLDLSPSMDAVDLAPSRIARARRAAADLLRAAHGERLGLVVFGADAFAAAPLVSDAAALTHLLRGLSPATVPRAGSRPDLALGLAREMLEAGGIVSGDVILVGDSAGGAQTLGAARELERAGFPVSVLAVGTPAGGPVQRSDGSLVRRAAGGILVVKPELAALERVAREGGGRFRLLPAGGPTPVFAPAARIWAADAAAPAQGAKVRVDDGAWLALLALPFAALLFRRGWLMGLAVFALGLAAAPRPALAFDWHALWQRPAQQAADAYAAGGARERVAALARLAPDSPWCAALLYRSGRYAEAAGLYARRDDAGAWYNRANALALDGKLEEALGAYDAALERSPSMRDARANRAEVRAAIARRFANEQGRSGAARQRGKGPAQAPRANEPRATQGNVARRPDRSEAAGDARRASPSGPPRVAAGNARGAGQRRLDALLAEVPDHPGELLANRFARELRLRGDWTHDPGEPW